MKSVIVWCKYRELTHLVRLEIRATRSWEAAWPHQGYSRSQGVAEHLHMSVNASATNEVSSLDDSSEPCSGFQISLWKFACGPTHSFNMKRGKWSFLAVFPTALIQICSFWNLLFQSKNAFASRKRYLKSKWLSLYQRPSREFGVSQLPAPCFIISADSQTSITLLLAGKRDWLLKKNIRFGIKWKDFSFTEYNINSLTCVRLVSFQHLQQTPKNTKPHQYWK